MVDTSRRGPLSAWAVWFFIARVTLYEVSVGARLEVSEAAHPVEAQVAGRVRATHVVLGQEVQFGDVLVELDVGTAAPAEEERTRLAALASQPTGSATRLKRKRRQSTKISRQGR